VAAVAGRRLSEGLGRTSPHCGLGLLMPPERSPPEKKASAVLRYPARPRHPTVCPQSVKALCVRGQRACPAYSSRSAPMAECLGDPKSGRDDNHIADAHDHAADALYIGRAPRGCRECQRARALRWWKKATLAACRSGRPARAEQVVLGTAGRTGSEPADEEPQSGATRGSGVFVWVCSQTKRNAVLKTDA